MSSSAEAAAARLIDVLLAQGFERTDRGSVALLHERKFRVSRFGVVDAVVGVAVESTASAESLRALQETTKAGALELKTRLPRGLGSAIEIFPVLFADHADEGALAAASAAAPMAWGIMSTHAIVHGENQRVTRHEGRVIWGAAYVRGLRGRLSGWLAA